MSRFAIQRTCCVLLLIAALCWAQSYTAAVRGVVTDTSGASVPGAKVIVTEADRNVDHVANTDAAGRYAIVALPPGNYNMTVEATGFKKYVQARFPLAVQQQATIDVQMQVGDIASTVEVTGEAPMLNTTISALGQVVENKYILSMPNLGRDSLSLAYMTRASSDPPDVWATPTPTSLRMERGTQRRMCWWTV
jgi:hypothetical protein